ncbi:4,5-DOPA dioxygenase extradiol [Caulobacter sp. KR2-114]|uniref:4,5-DOPA-extradiol-dioxygenase n=1 Tax=Caulobacter sp. KR2-114 TaxID=3400912 RepID=UPI003C08F584
MARLPAVFFGHGSPTIALETNETTATWNRIGREIGKPKAILCISAHWLTNGVGVTAMARPRTIHDFGRGLGEALFQVQYPAPGDPALAARVKELLSPELNVVLDQNQWGLDHGCWSVLSKAYPDADVPIVQLSMDASKPPAWHYAMGQKLAPLREEGVLIVGSGNVVHNLRVMDWPGRWAQPYDWAVRFNDYIRDAVATDQPQKVIDYASQGQDAVMSVPDPDHYWPLLYVLGTRAPGEAARFDPDHFEHKSLSMMSIVLGAHENGASKAA